MNCYKCNTGGYSPGELVEHEVEKHGYPPPIMTQDNFITTKEARRRIDAAVAAAYEECAKIADEFGFKGEFLQAYGARARRIAAAIRARGVRESTK